MPVNGNTLEDGRNVKEVFESANEFPLTLKFARPKMTTNEKIFLASMFYPLFAIASQLSPEPKSSGIQVLEADTFKLQCFQTLTGDFQFAILKKRNLSRESCNLFVFLIPICRREIHGCFRNHTSRYRCTTQTYL